jgi:RNA polymerase sigma-70 factor, ECF subfamily
MRTPNPRPALVLSAPSRDTTRAGSPDGLYLDHHEVLAAAGRALIESVRTNPDRGAAALFRQFSGLVNQLILHITGGDAEHDDIVQSVFCTLIDTIHQVREPQKLEAWVRAVTVNAALQQLRKQRFRRLFLKRLPEVTTTRSVVQDVEARDLLRRARRVLDLMPPGERVVFVLHHLESQTLASIAETCGYSVPTAKRRLAKANKRFQQLVEYEPELVELVQSRKKGSSSR